MMKKWLILILLPMSAAYAVSDGEAAEPRRITLEEALSLAERAPMAAVLVREEDLARAGLRGAGLWPNPELSLSREEAGGSEDRFADVTIPIPLTGRLSLERSAARSRLRAAEARTRQFRMGLLRGGVREAFLELLAAQERASIVEAALARLGELVEVLRAREREGESSGFDRMRAERERAETEADLMEAQVREAWRRASLAALLALPSEEIVAAGSMEPSGSLPAAEGVRALAASRGDIAALEAEAEGADSLARAAKRRVFPEPLLTAGTKTTEAGGASDTGGVLGIAFTLPIFDRGQGTGAAAKAEAALFRARREALAREAEARAQAALTETKARRAAEAAYSAGGDPEDLVRIAWAAYDGGEMRILDLLDACRTALSARLRGVELRLEARRAEVELNRVVGEEVVR